MVLKNDSSAKHHAATCTCTNLCATAKSTHNLPIILKQICAEVPALTLCPVYTASVNEKLLIGILSATSIG